MLDIRFYFILFMLFLYVKFMKISISFYDIER